MREAHLREPYLREDLARAWAGRDPFDVVRGLRGEVYRDQPDRRTVRFEVDGRGYFAKHHTGVGWREIVKNWLVLRRPVVDAANEFVACVGLGRAGVRVPTPAAFGSRGVNPAQRESFIVCDELAHYVSLARVTEQWLEAPPTFALKRRVIDATARLVREMHDARVVHRDLYLHHVFADERALARGDVVLALVDLHRARIVPRVSRYWRLRDLAALFFWCLDRPFGRRDALRFISIYEQRPMREALRADARFWRDVERRAISLYRKGRRNGIVANRFDPDA